MPPEVFQKKSRPEGQRRAETAGCPRVRGRDRAPTRSGRFQESRRGWRLEALIPNRQLSPEADYASGWIPSERPMTQAPGHVAARELDACKPATLVVSCSISAHGESR